MQSSSESCSASANCPQRSTEVAVENAHASPPHCFARNPRWRAVDKSCVKFALITEVTKNKNGKLWWMNSHCRHQTTPTNIPRDRQFPSNIVHNVRPTRRSRHCHTRSLRLRSSSCGLCLLSTRLWSPTRMVLPATLANCSPCWRRHGDRRGKYSPSKHWPA